MRERMQSEHIRKLRGPAERKGNKTAGDGSSMKERSGAAAGRHM